ncbi:DUF863 domain-containing protein [Cephalotus follicularis]|uniref:DUF863 domain-containing protein n=1 Tax=Cephalotus follicularis TaxID=3775 RepID=A0A1Q3BKI2_CEPFO|nr:DUF863 domain-containing protein [Cephalotus follicularis]
MALLGMQVDTQGGGYIPRYYSVRDLNLNPLNDVGSLLNGQHHNGALLLLSSDQHLEYTKEVLKQTILKQDAIFEDQIQELHRLYWRQKELMDEMKMNALYKHHRQIETSHSNPVLSLNSVDYALETCHIPRLTWMKSACDKSSAENNLLPRHFIQGNSTQTGPDPTQNEGYSKDSELLESKYKKIGNKILDLHLPADVYVDSEEEESLVEENVSKVAGYSGYPLQKISQGLCEIDVKPSVGSGDLNSVFQEDNMTVNSFPSETKVLVDLNEPVNLEEDAALMSSNILELVTEQGNIVCQDLLGERNSDFHNLYKEIVPNMQTRQYPEACSSFLHPMKSKRHKKSLSYDDEPGQSRWDLNSSPQCFCAEKTFMACENVELQKALAVPTSDPLDESNIESSSERTSNSESIRDVPAGNTVASDICTSSNQLIPSNVENSSLSVVLSRRKPTRESQRTPIAVQALPCFNTFKSMSRSSKSPIGSPGLAGCKHSNTRDLKPFPEYDSVRFKWSRFCSDSQLKSKTLEAHPPSISDGLNCSDDNNSSDNHAPIKCIKGSEDVKLAYNMGVYSMSPGCSSDVSTSQNDQITDGEIELEDSTGESPSQAPPATIHKCLSEDKGKENSEKCGVQYMKLDGNPAPDSGEQLIVNELVVGNGIDRKDTGFRFRVDMNSRINEDESSLKALHSATIYFQAPASPENKESSPPRGESDENQLEVCGSHENQIEMSIQSLQDNGDSEKELVSIAASAIVTISSSGIKTCQESSTCEPMEIPWIESLHWLAKVVSSKVCGSESGCDVALGGEDSGDHDREDCLSDGMDYFETMTLQLAETKVEDSLYNINVPNEEEKRPASFPSQRRRGRTRRGRQHRKNFRSEILPSLTSLSRYEVIEDLQTIGGLFKAADAHSGSCRYAGRKGWIRGKRQSYVSSGMENLVSKQQASNTEMVIEDGSLIHWGKIARRRRGQRSPAGNLWPIIGQV